MEFIIRNLMVQNLKAQIALRRYVCEFLVREFQTPTLTARERAAIADRWDATLKESFVFQLMLDLTERQKNEELAAVSHSTATQYLSTANVQL